MTDSCNLFSFMKITVRPRDPRLNDATSLVLFIDGLILSLKNLFFVVLLLPCGPSIHVEMPMKVGVVLCGPFH